MQGQIRINHHLLARSLKTTCWSHHWISREKGGGLAEKSLEICLIHALSIKKPSSTGRPQSDQCWLQLPKSALKKTGGKPCCFSGWNQIYFHLLSCLLLSLALFPNLTSSFPQDSNQSRITLHLGSSDSVVKLMIFKTLPSVLHKRLGACKVIILGVSKFPIRPLEINLNKQL